MFYKTELCIMICSHCSKKISRHIRGSGSKTNHYRSCDANVCSWKCAVTRRDEISVFDPDLNSPSYWQYFNAEDIESASKLKRSSSEYSLRNNTKYDDQFSMIVLPIISEENEREIDKNDDTKIHIVLFFIMGLSLLCIIC